MLNVIFLMSMVIYSSGNRAVNLALDKPTVMSSKMLSFHSSYAVDGSMGTDLDNDGCSHTALDDMTPWWLVDMHGTYHVTSVIITNRGDACWERLHSFVIEVFEHNPQRCASAITKVCVNNTGTMGQGETKTFTCETPVRGRFVRVRKWKMNSTDDCLTLCEVQIFGNNQIGCEFPQYLQRTEGIRLRSQHVEQISGMTPIECAAKCGEKNNCVAFNFNINTQECELIFNPKFSDTKEIQPVWNYYGSDLC